jgi:molecular chaperone DnaJ
MSEENLNTDDLYAIKDINLYEILCITKETFTPELVKKKHRKLSLKYHPDKNIGVANCEERFQMLHLAYQILSNKEKRTMYDYIYESSQECEDFDQMKTYERQYEGDFYTGAQFAEKLEEFDRNTDPDYGKNVGKMSDMEAFCAMGKSREEVLPADMKEKFKTDMDNLEKIENEKDRQNKFNEMFDTMAQLDEDVGEDLMLYNGNTTLLDMGTASTTNYSTMYSNVNTYDEAFKINSSHLHEELDPRSYEEQMAEYENAYADLDEMSKTSKLNNGRADFGSDYV